MIALENPRVVNRCYDPVTCLANQKLWGGPEFGSICCSTGNIVPSKIEPIQVSQLISTNAVAFEGWNLALILSRLMDEL